MLRVGMLKNQSKHRIQLPATEHYDVSQSEAFFNLLGTKGDKQKISFHDYEKIYSIPGLYEQIFYDRLRCSSPQVVTEALYKAVNSTKDYFTELRVLDFGAGNGLMGEALNKYGISRLVGVDIEPEAERALVRDRPGIYDEYYTRDFLNLDDADRKELKSWSFDCLTTVAALGFGDIPVGAFLEAVNLVREDGWVAFNIKDSFLNPSDESGFSKLIRNIILSEYFDVYSIERYRHRLSMEGVPLFYYSVVGKKRQHIPFDIG
jgi:SAM-dependent methyltransferase